MCPSTDGCVLAESWCACEPPRPVCAQCIQAHRRHPDDDGLVGGLASRARLAVELPVACHLRRRHTTFLHIDPRALLWPLLAPWVVEQRGLFEKEYVVPRRQA